MINRVNRVTEEDIQLVEVTKENQHLLKKIIPFAEQEQFSSRGEYFLKYVGASYGTLYLILLAGETAGLFFIHIEKDDFKQFANNQPYASLLGLTVDQHYQGRGLAQAAMSLFLKEFKVRHPGFDHIILTVNCKNPAAKRVYEKVGFADTGELYKGGPAGPQYIMVWQ
jgi:ribosomal protein S18 acetylase RimI-like enzyme